MLPGGKGRPAACTHPAALPGPREACLLDASHIWGGGMITAIGHASDLVLVLHMLPTQHAMHSAKARVAHHLPLPLGPALLCTAGKRALGPVAPEHAAAAAEANCMWLQDAIMHLLCVLALDRFGDYGSDQVGTRRHAPLRWTQARAAMHACTGVPRVLLISTADRQLGCILERPRRTKSFHSLLSGAAAHRCRVRSVAMPAPGHRAGARDRRAGAGHGAAAA